MTTIQLLAQGVGLIGAAIMISSFQFKSTKTLFAFQAVSSCMFLIQFIMLGAMTGAVMNVISLLRGVVLALGGRYRILASRWVMGLILAASLIAGICTYENWISILPTVGMLVSTVFMWMRNGKKLRLAQLFVVSPVWLTYNLCVLSLTGAMTEAFNIISVIVSIARHGLKGLDCAE